jgi:hypothetical protein
MRSNNRSATGCPRLPCRNHRLPVTGAGWTSRRRCSAPSAGSRSSAQGSQAPRRTATPRPYACPASLTGRSLADRQAVARPTATVALNPLQVVRRTIRQRCSRQLSTPRPAAGGGRAAVVHRRGARAVAGCCAWALLADIGRRGLDSNARRLQQPGERNDDVAASSSGTRSTRRLGRSTPARRRMTVRALVERRRLRRVAAVPPGPVAPRQVSERPAERESADARGSRTKARVVAFH